MKLLAATALALTLAAPAHAELVVSPGNELVTYLHVGANCTSFTTDQTGDVTFAIPAAAKPFSTGGEYDPKANNAAMSADVIAHAVNRVRFLHFLYENGGTVRCEGTDAFPVQDLDTRPASGANVKIR